MERVVLDTNVIVSALLLRGRLASLVELWKQRSLQPVICRETFDELRAVLGYPRFSLSGHEIRAIIEDEVLPYFEVVELNKQVAGVCRDPHDDVFLSLALSAKASHIVTGDNDLLDLKTHDGVKIVSPREYLDSLGIA